MRRSWSRTRQMLYCWPRIGGPKWNHTDPAKATFRAGASRIRKALGLYANLAPVKIFDAAASQFAQSRSSSGRGHAHYVRELTGGLYFGDRARETGVEEPLRGVQARAPNETNDVFGV